MRKFAIPLFALLAAAMVGCETSTPNSQAQKASMRDETQSALNKFESQDPGLRNLLNSSSYAIFPDIGKAAVGIGGAHGQGEVFRNGQMVGYVTMDQASIGPQVEGESYSELIVFQNEHALNRLMNNSLEFGAQTSAEFVKAGAAAAGSFNNGVRVFILPRGGLGAGASISGQKFHFTPANNANTASYDNNGNYNNR